MLRFSFVLFTACCFLSACTHSVDPQIDYIRVMYKSPAPGKYEPETIEFGQTPKSSSPADVGRAAKNTKKFRFTNDTTAPVIIAYLQDKCKVVFKSFQKDPSPSILWKYTYCFYPNRKGVPVFRISGKRTNSSYLVLANRRDSIDVELYNENPVDELPKVIQGDNFIGELIQKKRFIEIPVK